MLISLHIVNFAVVKTLELDLYEGMTAFTGETGAGKSIMIDALLLALGSRADTSVIRQGEDKCSITATFALDAQSKPARWLAAHDIDGQDNQLIMRRVLYAEGAPNFISTASLCHYNKPKSWGKCLCIFTVNINIKR